MNEQSAYPDDAELRQTLAELSDQQLQTALETAANCFAIGAAPQSPSARP